MNKSLVKLNLGCSNRKIHGFTNVDIRTESNADLIDDCFKLSKFENNSVDLIFASHVLEHSTRKGAIDVLKRWHDVLKPSGELYVAVPDLEMVFQHYILHQDLRYLMGFLYGGQRQEHDFHYIGFDEKTLREDLLEVGFRSAERYDWRKTEWSYIDSYEQSYFPHMDKKGLLMSLNMKASKL